MIITNSKPGVFGISSIQDVIDEGFENIKLKVSHIENGEIIGSDELNLVIEDDDNANSPPGVSFSVDKSTIQEDEGSFDINIQLSKTPNQGDVEILFDFDGTASEDDFTVSENPIKISSGTTGKVTITAVQDEIDEPNESILLRVSSISNAGGALGSIGSVTILDDDEPVPLSLERSGDDVNVYPNPFVDHITIELDRSWDGDVELSLYDMFGRVSKTENIINSSVNFTHRIELSNTNYGLYIIKIKQKEKVLIKKLIREN